MDHLEHPSLALWEERRQWIESLIESYESKAGYLVSEQACALTAEVQSVFCAGAWITVIILCATVVDAQLREVEAPDFKGNTKELLDLLDLDPKLQHLRKRRNQLIHLNIDNPAITVDQQWSNRRELEVEAREAVELMFEAFFSGPWI